MTRSRVALISGLVGAVLVLAGCGGDAEPTAVETVTVTVTPTPTTPGPTPTPAASDPGVDLTTPPTTYDEALAHIAAASDVGSLDRFTTPSGNIYCALLVDSQPAACEIGAGAVEDAEVCDVPEISAFVSRIELTNGVATPICATDTIRLPDPPELFYGAVTTTRDTQCVSEQIGVTCVSRSGSGGFFLRQGQYLLF